jgi:hypothetical protein
MLYPAVGKIILKNYFPQTDEGIITKVPTQTQVLYLQNNKLLGGLLQDLQQVGGLLWFPPPIKLAAMM